MKGYPHVARWSVLLCLVAAPLLSQEIEVQPPRPTPNDTLRISGSFSSSCFRGNTEYEISANEVRFFVLEHCGCGNNPTLQTFTRDLPPLPAGRYEARLFRATDPLSSLPCAEILPEELDRTTFLVTRGARSLLVEPAAPTTADEVTLLAPLDCAAPEDLEAFAAGERWWHVLAQPAVGDPPACSGVPLPFASVSLGHLEPGTHTAILLGQDPNVGYPIELDLLTFEVRQADSPILDLRAGRFRAAARWTVPAGSDGDAHAVPLTSDSGAFWFFRPDNLELMVKVLDGCAVNGHYWVLGAGLTDVGVELEITDTLTGSSWTHASPAGSPFAPVQDTGAFDCP